jgi:hypothetical protein
MQKTIAEFAAMQGVDANDAGGFIGFLVAKGKATKTGENRVILDAEGKPKRGRPSAIFDIPDEVSIKLA